MFDPSTLNQTALRKLKPYTCPPTYHIDNHLGAGCYGDPPGFPTYFLRSVYTQHGNSPAKGPSHTIRDDGGIFRRIPEHDWSGTRAEWWDRWTEQMRALWVPLPYDHPRVRAWIRQTYKHMQHCYKDTLGRFPLEYGEPATVIYPVPYYKLEHYHDDPRFSDSYREAAVRLVNQKNDEIKARHREVCIPERHAAYLIVRRYYPEHTPDLALIDHPGKSPGDWWETEDTQPTPESCTAGQVMGPQGLVKLYRGCSGPSALGAGWRHPTGQTWCQWCGWRKAKQS